MEVYRILKLTIWSGDHFDKSWSYTEIGITDDIDLVKKLESVRVEESETLPWPAYCMKGWKVYKTHKIDLIKKWDDHELINLDSED